MNINDIQDVLKGITSQWLAGFFDGEGSIWTRSMNKHYSIVVGIAQKNPSIIAALSLKFPNCVVSKRENTLKNNKGFSYGHKIVWNGKNALPVLEFIEPYLLLKKKQAILAIEFCKLVTYSGGRTTVISKERRDEITTSLNNINKENTAPDRVQEEYKN